MRAALCMGMCACVRVLASCIVGMCADVKVHANTVMTVYIIRVYRSVLLYSLYSYLPDLANVLVPPSRALSMVPCESLGRLQIGAAKGSPARRNDRDLSQSKSRTKRSFVDHQLRPPPETSQSS